MGTSASKLRKYLQRGDEYAALQLCERHSDLRKSLDPNTSYGEQFGHNTPLHFAAKHSMKALIRTFLNDLGANPNKKNGDDSTALHLICQGGTRMSRHLDGKIRSDCLAMFLAWQSPPRQDDQVETADINAQDNIKNTALHYAAASGLKLCVELLVTKGADLSMENDQQETPCDTAERCAHRDIAEYLETIMVFHNDGKVDTDDEDILPTPERFSGLRETDLIEAKDLLLIETCDMLQVPLFTAEALLRNHEWSRESLWLSWNRDPVACCNKCRVQPPTSALQRDSPSAPQPDHPLVPSSNVEQTDQSIHIMCEICMDEVETSSSLVTNGECGHSFCKLCWKQYISVKIREGDLHNIICPAHECSKLVPLDLVERVVSPSTARRYLKFDIKAFVESNPKIKWCPFPECSNAVRLPDVEEEPPMYLRVFPKLQPPPPTSKTVSCPQGHSFCWDCLLDGHEPTCCPQWNDWHNKISQVRPEELRDTGSANESAANCLWLVTNSKPCPKCRSPIQKNEGCNHMKCSKCKHDFCWVCLGPWKKHSTETGGYFRCNRYDDSRKVDDKTEQAIAEAKEQSKKAQELNRFVHYYSRYKNHLNSFQMENCVLSNIESKVQSLTKSAPKNSDSPEKVDFSFVTDGIKELLRCRKVLSSSYAYGYFLKDCGYNKTIFEYLQNELEVSVETLSSLVGRNYLRGSKTRICRSSQIVACRRQRFLICICRGLVPPETPPALRKSRKRHLPALLGLDKDDDDWVKSGLPALDSVDPGRPWVKDTGGKHHNLMAILDWPQEDDSDENEDNPTNNVDDEYVTCCMTECNRPKARNPRTGTLHPYCSLKCQYMASCHQPRGSSRPSRQYNVDLMIALQMSRLQLLQDLKLLCDDSDEDSSPTHSKYLRPSSSNKFMGLPSFNGLGDEVDPDVQLAIERSVSDLPTDPNSLAKYLKGVAEKEEDPTKLVTNLLDKCDIGEDKLEDKILLKDSSKGRSARSLEDQPGPSPK